MVAPANGFAEWLTDEMARRDWQRADLARVAGIARATLSNIMNGMRGPGPEVCVKLARALGYTEQEVMRRAGLLTKDVDDMGLSDWIAAGRQLTADERAELLVWVYAKLGQRSK